MKKIIILAGSRIEFERYLDENGLTTSDVVYGYEPDVMAGVEASRVEIIGSFYERKNALKLEEFARTRVR